MLLITVALMWRCNAFSLHHTRPPSTLTRPKYDACHNSTEHALAPYKTRNEQHHNGVINNFINMTMNTQLMTAAEWAAAPMREAEKSDTETFSLEVALHGTMHLYHDVIQYSIRINLVMVWHVSGGRIKGVMERTKRVKREHMAMAINI